MQANSITPGSNVIIVDDLIATGGRSHLQHFSAYFILLLIFVSYRWICQSSGRTRVGTRRKNYRISIYHRGALPQRR